MAFGSLDRIDSSGIHGWAWDDASEGKKLTVEILADGEIVGEASAELFRKDLLDAGFGDGCCAFLWPVPAAMYDGRERLVQARPKNGDVLSVIVPLDKPYLFAGTTDGSGGAPQEPPAGDAGAEAADAAVVAATYVPTPVVVIPAVIHGSIEMISEVLVQGWAWNASAPDERLTVEILLDGTVVGTSVADGLREDLAEAKIGDGRCAFAWTFPPGLFDGRPHEVGVMVMGQALGTYGKVDTIVRHQNSVLGAVDAVAAESVGGWAIDHRIADRPAEIAVYVGEDLIGRGKCESFREDIWRTHQGHGFYGFRVVLLRRLMRPDYPLLRVVVMPGEYALRVYRDFQDRLAEPLSGAARLKGHLDKADRTAILGWAVDTNAPAQPLTVDIHINQAIIRSARAANLRSDMKNAYPEAGGQVGYAHHPPYGWSLDGAASVEVTIGPERHHVDGSPATVRVGRSGLPYESAAFRRHVVRHRRKFLAAQPESSPDQVAPRVCAIVLNRDGAEFLEKLFASIWLHNTYPELQVVVVDHGSSDGSGETCRRWSDRIAISFVERRTNYSYSASNNFGAMQTDAEILFLLNNDIEFDSDFVGAAVRHLEEDVCIVGLKLATPPTQVRLASGASRKSLLDVGYAVEQIQHLGVRISTSADDRPFIPFEEPINRDNQSFATQPMEVAGVTAAALFMRRVEFLAIGGFHEEYYYGFEDVDLCLTARSRLGKKIICLNDHKAYHHRSASIDRSSQAEKEAKAANRDIMLRRVGGYVQRSLKEERATNAPFLRDTFLQVGFLVSEVSDTTPAGDYFTALELASELSDRFGYECRFIPREDWYDLRDCDVAIAMVDGFRPSLVQSARSDILLVLWARNWFDRWLALADLQAFDEIWASSDLAQQAFLRRTNRPVHVVRIATKLERFERGVASPALRSDYCFTGSNFGSWRQIIGCLSPQDLPYDFKLFGHGWEKIAWLRPYWQGSLGYDEMANIYASTKIVIDDANHTTLAWGATNSRVFDAIGAGALVVTNSRTASDDSFDGELPVFSDRESLVVLLHRYLRDEPARLSLVARLRAMVRERHTYALRANGAYASIQRMLLARRFCLNLPEDRAQQLEPLRRLFETELLGRGFVFHRIAGVGGLSRARAFGAEIDLRFTNFDGGELPGGPLSVHRCNVLLLCCDIDQLRPADVRKFDLIITVDEAAAREADRLGSHGIAIARNHTPQAGTSAIERRLILQSLIEHRLADLLTEMMPMIEEILVRKAEIPAAIGPSLTIPAAPVSGERALRIAYVLWDFPALSQTFVLNEIRYLAKHGQDVKVYFRADPDRRAPFDCAVDTYRINDAQELAALLRLHDRTVMHSPFAYPATTLLTFPASEATGIPFTIMPAGVDVSHYDNIARNRIADVTRSPNCLGVITIGSFHHKLLLEQGVPESKIVLERQAVDLPDIAGKRDTERAATARPRVISIGRMIEKKGFAYLIHAAGKLPELDFVIYGFGPLEGELRQLAHTVGTANLTFGGSLDTTEALWSAYANADVFTLPCVRAADGDVDGLPTVLVEAMAAGVPVVSTRTANVPDLVVDGITGFLCKPHDDDDLVRGLRQAVDMTPARRERMVAAARKRAVSYANVERTVKTLLRLWQARGPDIVLVTYDIGKYQDWTETDQIISRIFKFTTPPFQVYVVDNGSTEDFLGKLWRNYGGLPNFHLTRLSNNIKCGPGTNMAAAQGSGDYIIYLCSKEGYVLRRGWEQEAIRYMERNPGIGLAGHLVTMPRHYDGQTYQSLPLFSKFRNTEFAADNTARRFSHVQGGVYILRRSVYEAHGGFSEAVPQDGTDVEYSYYLESQGVELGDIPNIYSVTTKTLPGIEAMLDENIIAAHPLSSQKIGHIDRVARREGCTCNVCLWQGPAFLESATIPEETICPSCKSSSFSRTVLRLLSLDATLQMRPRTWARLGDKSLGAILSRLATKLTLVDPGRDGARAWPDQEPCDLVIIDHLAWSANDTRDFVKWAKPFVAKGGALIIGGTLSDDGAADPLAALAKAGVALAPVEYDSAVFRYDWRPIGVANMSIHP